MKQTQRYYHIDLIRFVLSTVIVFYHILHSNIIPYTDGMTVYSTLAGMTNYAANIVTCFFLIGGVFLYRSYESNPDKPVFEYVLGRAARLAPALIAAILLESLLNGKLHWERSLINALFLQCSGLSLEYKGILWYISSYFFATVFLYALLASLPKRKALLVIAIISYFSFVFRINYQSGNIGGRETVFYVLNLGVVRAVGEVGLGILLGEVYGRLHRMLEFAPLGKKTGLALRILQGAFEIAAVCFLFVYFLFSRRVSNHIILVIIFSGLLLSLLSSSSLIGMLFNRKFFGLWGKYAYSIYVFQQTSFYLLQKTLWPVAGFTARPMLALTVSTALSVCLGIALYYLIEQPCARLYSRWYKRYRQRCA